MSLGSSSRASPSGDVWLQAMESNCLPPSLFEEHPRVERSEYRDMLLHKIHDLAPLLRNNALANSTRRTIAPETVHALRASGLFAALAPREVGGLEVDPITELELIEAVSRIDGSTGWAFMAGAGSTARVASVIPDPIVDEVFGTNAPFPIIAFQVLAHGAKAEQVDGGFVISGTWPYGTGVRHADWVVAVSRRVEPSKSEAEIACIVPVSQVEVLDTLTLSGLVGSGTFDYRLDGVFVPEQMTWPYPPRQPIRAQRSFCFKRAPIKHIGFALGVAHNSLDCLVQHLARRASSGSVRQVTYDEVGRASVGLTAAWLVAFRTVEEVWNSASSAEHVPLELAMRLRAVARYSSEVAREICNLVVAHGGASSLDCLNPLQVNLRDMNAGAQHAEVSAAAYGELGEHLITR